MERRKGESAREYLERIPSFAKKKSTRPEVRAFLGLMGNPDRKFRIFHVAGTNGKGSVCALRRRFWRRKRPAGRSLLPIFPTSGSGFS